MDMDMDMNMDMSMNMNMPSANTSSNATTMSMSMSPNGCKMSMLLNWSTLDTCYLTSTIHIHHPLQFLLICLFSFLLPITLEFTRRYQRTYDRYLRSKHLHLHHHPHKPADETTSNLLGGDQLLKPQNPPWTRSVMLEQAVRAALHVLQFTISYCVMMMWMYSNGYILICILSGAMVGFGMATRDMLDVSVQESELDEREQTCC